MASGTQLGGDAVSRADAAALAVLQLAYTPLARHHADGNRVFSSGLSGDPSSSAASRRNSRVLSTGRLRRALAVLCAVDRAADRRLVRRLITCKPGILS